MQKTCPPERGSFWIHWEDDGHFIRVLVIRMVGDMVIFDAPKLCRKFWCTTDVETFCKYFEPDVPLD